MVFLVRSLAIFILFLSVINSTTILAQSPCLDQPSPVNCTQPWTVMPGKNLTVVIPNTTPPCSLQYKVFYRKRCNEYYLEDFSLHYSQCMHEYIQAAQLAIPPRSMTDIVREWRQMCFREFMYRELLNNTLINNQKTLYKCGEGHYFVGYASYESACVKMVYKYRSTISIDPNQYFELSLSTFPPSMSWATIANTLATQYNADISTLQIGYSSSQECGIGCCRKQYTACWDEISGAWNMMNDYGEVYPPGTNCNDLEFCYPTCTPY